MSIDQLLDAPMNVKDMTTQVESTKVHDPLNDIPKAEIRELQNYINTSDFTAERYDINENPDAILAIHNLFPEVNLDKISSTTILEQTNHSTSLETVVPSNEFRGFERYLSALASFKSATGAEVISRINDDEYFKEELNRIIDTEFINQFARLAIAYAIIDPGAIKRFNEAIKWPTREDIHDLVSYVFANYISHEESKYDDLNYTLKTLAGLKVMYPDFFSDDDFEDAYFWEQVDMEIKSKDTTDFRKYSLLLYKRILKSRKTTIFNGKIHCDMGKEEYENETPLPTVRRFGK